ncbi:unannotated protein [freshwater metagenome]|uniref:Unannotated protein n=1 Tax=freshwater metagenome TaxID=449393 RepID=A0A6J7GDX1_9ZZZZ
MVSPVAAATAACSAPKRELSGAMATGWPARSSIDWAGESGATSSCGPGVQRAIGKKYWVAMPYCSWMVGMNEGTVVITSRSPRPKEGTWVVASRTVNSTS